MYIYVCMAKSLTTWINEIKNHLQNKGLKKDIPLNDFYSAFMILSGYNQRKIIEWTDNFKMVGLIKIEDERVNFET